MQVPGLVSPALHSQGFPVPDWVSLITQVCVSVPDPHETEHSPCSQSTTQSWLGGGFAVVQRRRRGGHNGCLCGVHVQLSHVLRLAGRAANTRSGPAPKIAKRGHSQTCKSRIRKAMMEEPHQPENRTPIRLRPIICVQNAQFNPLRTGQLHCRYATYQEPLSEREKNGETQNRRKFATTYCSRAGCTLWACRRSWRTRTSRCQPRAW